MSTITETHELRENSRPLGNLQAKIDADLLDEADLIATRQTIKERRKVFRRDVVEAALRAYLPQARKALEAQALEAHALEAQE
jgi:hypothetical protein